MRWCSRTADPGRAPRPSAPIPVFRAGWPLTVLLLALALVPPAARGAPTDEDCLECHDDDALSMKRGERTVSLHVRAAVLRSSAHAKVACVECHVGFDPDEEPHLPKIPPVRCVGCHDDAAARHSFHAAMVAQEMERNGSAGCKRCHGTHDTRPAPSWKAGGAGDGGDCRSCHEKEVVQFERSAHGRALAAGQEEAPRCVTCHEKAVVDGPKPTAAVKVEQEKLCLSCHLDDPAVRQRVGPQAGFIAAYDQSVHGSALHAGKAEAANCVDCHGSHEMAVGLDPDSRASKAHIPATCGRCHDEVAKHYDASVHASALAQGSADSPVCTDCHGEHTILKTSDPRSPVAPTNLSEQVCSPCHSSVRLSTKYGIRSDRFRTFDDSFHGLAIRGGSVAAANCASCHGSHEILPSTDPRSTVHPANLAKTCGECHKGATAAFASGKVHVDPTTEDEPLLYWIGLIYTLLIGGTIGGMFVHNALDFSRKASHRLRVRRGLASEAHAPASRALYLRMTVSERVQHGLLVVSFTVLVLTGFALRYPEAWLFEGIRRFSATLFEWRGITHRIAGVVMIAASLFHIGYLTLTARGREFFRDMRPRPSDLTDVKNAVRYYLGRTRERPRFGRFSYVEKSEYWALVWGSVVMAATGVVLWFQDPAIALLTKLGWDAARSIHVYEAVLATLAILVWHLYFVVFNPDVYPMNLAWLTGTLSEEEMRDEHPLELEATEKRRQDERTSESKDEGRTEGASLVGATAGRPSSEATTPPSEEGGTT
ncbi:MAG TPA: cytochrome c3 family protein [Candidatus Eisenbacteria bacterium]|nr:cytochrome c3 family protein [Candidatus Eisenbacteria bacterium]